MKKVFIFLIMCTLSIALLYACGKSSSSLQNENTETIITPDSSAISFYQVVFTFSEVIKSQQLTQQTEGIYSGTGMFVVDMQSLNKDGFVQVVTPLGWVVQNLPVAAGTEYSKMAVKFRLGENKENPPVDTINAYVVVTSQPITSAPTGDMSEWPVTPHKFDAEGIGNSVTEIPDPPPVNENFITAGLSLKKAAEEWPYDNIFGSNKNDKALDIHYMENSVGKNFNICMQKNHADKNIEAAKSQCGPASVTNSLSWLKEIWGTTLPHSIGMGLKGDNTTVGKLDTAMNRNVTDRRNGKGVSFSNFINGKLKYLADNKICLVVKHQAAGLGGTDQDYNGFKSQAKGEKPTFEFICKEICKGEDVEIGYLYFTGGGHAVNAIGCGHIYGKPFIVHVSDHNQADDIEGTEFIDFDFLEDKNKDGYLELTQEQAENDIVVTESPPEIEGVNAKDVCPWLKDTGGGNEEVHIPNGTYTGDGGCGLNEVVVISNSDTKLIVTIPGNDDITFVGDGSSCPYCMFSASGLTIFGVPGHDAMIELTPPNHFAFSAFNQSGGSCEELFVKK